MFTHPCFELLTLADVKAQGLALTVRQGVQNTGIEVGERVQRLAAIVPGLIMTIDLTHQDLHGGRLRRGDTRQQWPFV
ncbi:hypothetical protein D3C73_731710 [compost metagenome]